MATGFFAAQTPSAQRRRREKALLPSPRRLYVLCASALKEPARASLFMTAEISSHIWWAEQ
jgi:hypothetical protein